jgi:electron transport complex protein RnfG
MSGETKHTDIQQEAEPSSLLLIGTLGVAGFLSGLILVSAFLITKPIIERNKAEALRQAIFKVLPGTTSFKTLELKDGSLTEVEKPEGEAIFLGLNDAKEMTGFAISDKEAGFQDLVGVIYGYDPNSKMIVGYEVLDCKETPGLGDKIFKDLAFVDNFKALVVDPEIILVKKGEKKNANEVDAITGATISSRTVVKLLNRSLGKWREPIQAFKFETTAASDVK